MPEFTKGPWKIEDRIVWGSDGYVMYRPFPNSQTGEITLQQESNLRLIKESPEMYRLMNSCLIELYESDGVPDSLQDAMRAVMDKIDGKA